MSRNERVAMKFNLLSDNKRIVEIAMLIGIVMVSVDAIMQNRGIAEKHFLWISGLGFLVMLWSIFSYIFVNAKAISIKPSRILGNILFLVLSAFWGIFMTWIYFGTQ